VLNAQVTWNLNNSVIEPDKNYDVKLPQGLQLNSRILFQDGSSQNTAYIPIWERVAGTNNIAYNLNGGFVGIGTNNPGSDLHIKGSIPNIRVENIGSGAAYMTFASNDYSWLSGVTKQNHYQIVDYLKHEAMFTIDGVTGNASLGDIMPDPYTRLRITGQPGPDGSKAAILFSNANHPTCQVTMGQDGANAIIEAEAPSNISSCQLLLNYYHNRPIGVWGEMTCKRDVIIGGQNENNGLLIQNTGIETLQENRTDNINAIGLKISHSGTDRFVVKGDGSLNIMPYGTGTRAISVKNDTGIDQFVVYSNGKVYAPEIRVKPINPWPDYVFEKDYKLMPLSELKSYIFKNKHLPNMPSATEVKTEGINMEKTLNKQQEKIEELTLYILQLEERLKALEGNGGSK